MSLKLITKNSIASTNLRFKSYLPFLAIGVLILCARSIVLSFGIQNGTSAFAAVQISEGIFHLLVSACLILKIQSPGEEISSIIKKALFLFPGFLVRNLGFSILLIMGLVLFVVPGLVVMTLLGMAPFIALLEPDEYSCFKRSITLSKRDLGSTFAVMISVLLIGVLDFALMGLNAVFIVEFFGFVASGVLEFYILTLIVELHRYLLGSEKVES